MKITSIINGTLIIDHVRAQDLTNAELRDVIMQLIARHDKDYLIDMIKEEVDWSEDAKE